jgi:hypothetical protein
VAVFFGFSLFNYCKGIDLRRNSNGYFFFTNLVNKSSVTPFKKVHKNYGKPADKKRLLRLLQKQASATDR